MDHHADSEAITYHQSNRFAWNEAAARYATEVEQDVAFLREGGKAFQEPEWSFLEGLENWCRRAVHLQCAGGLDTLSLLNHGAQEVIGVDISDRMIETARRKSEALNAPAFWYRCDVLETPHELDGTADLVYTGKGALYWIMDLEAWAKVVYRLLKPGGRLYIFEGHPLSWVWDPAAEDYKLDPELPYGNYFSTAISEGQGWPVEYIPESAVPPAEQQARKYERQWTLGQIMKPLADAGLRLVRFEEHPQPFWDHLPKLRKDLMERLPHTFSLLMRKE